MGLAIGGMYSTCLAVCVIWMSSLLVIFSSSNLLHQLLYLCALLHSWRCYQEFVLQLRPLRRQGFSHVVHQRCLALHGQSVISDYMQILICMWMGHHLTIWWFFLNAIFVFPGYASQIRSHTSWQIHDHVSSHLKHIWRLISQPYHITCLDTYSVSRQDILTFGYKTSALMMVAFGVDYVGFLMDLTILQFHL